MLLVPRRVTPSSMSPVPTYTPCLRDNVESSFLSREVVSLHSDVQMVQCVSIGFILFICDHLLMTGDSDIHPGSVAQHRLVPVPSHLGAPAC